MKCRCGECHACLLYMDIQWNNIFNTTRVTCQVQLLAWTMNILLTSIMVCQILLRLTSGIASSYQRDVNIKDSDFHRWHHLIDTDDYSFQKQLFPETFTSRIQSPLCNILIQTSTISASWWFRCQIKISYSRFSSFSVITVLFDICMFIITLKFSGLLAMTPNGVLIVFIKQTYEAKYLKIYQRRLSKTNFVW